MPARGYYALYLAYFALSLGVAVLATYIPEYVKLLDATPIWIGLFSTSFFLAGSVTTLPMGWLSDRYDKRLVLLLGLGMSLVSYVVFLIVDSAELLTLGRVCQGIGVTTAGITALAVVGEMSPKGQRGRQIGTLNAVRNLSSGLGAVAGGLLYTWFGFTVPYTLLMLLTVIAVALLWRCLPSDETRVTHHTFGPLVRNHRIQAMAAFRSMYAFAVMLVRTYVPNELETGR